MNGNIKPYTTDEATRFIIALGLLETDPSILKRGNDFHAWSTHRKSVADQVKGTIVEFALQEGIYRPDDTSEFENPTSSLYNRAIVLDGNKTMHRSPIEQAYHPIPQDFVEAVREYVKQVNQLGEMGDDLSGFIIPSVRRFRKYRRSGVYSPSGAAVETQGVTGSPAQISRLDSHVNTLFDHIKRTNNFDPEGCVISKATY